MPSFHAFLGCSLDGYIADAQGDLDWLDAYAAPEGSDLGYARFMAERDALLMGRNTFEKVLSFNVPWPYDKPVFVWTSKADLIPADLSGKAMAVKGDVPQVIEQLEKQKLKSVYADGGRTVQSLLQADRLDELTITQVPLLLGGGVPLFGSLNAPMKWERLSATSFGAHLQLHYRRQRED